jgi:hypothetical protein
MAEELDRREQNSAAAMSDLQQARAALDEQVARLRKQAMQQARVRVDKLAGHRAAPAPPPFGGSVDIDVAKGVPAIDVETFEKLRRSLKVRWRLEQGGHDEASVRAAFEPYGVVEHVMLRGNKTCKEKKSAVVVMATAAAAAAAARNPIGPPSAPLLVTPLPAAADLGVFARSGRECAAAAAARVRRADIVRSAPPPPSGGPGGRGCESVGGTHRPTSFPGAAKMNGATAAAPVGLNSLGGAPSSFPGGSSVAATPLPLSSTSGAPSATSGGAVSGRAGPDGLS